MILLTFSRSYGSGGTASYPRATDPIGNLFDVPIDAVSATTITVNALQGTSPTNTDAHMARVINIPIPTYKGQVLSCNR